MSDKQEHIFKNIFIKMNKLLIENDLSKIDFAKKMGTTRQNIHRMENSLEIKIEYLIKMSDFFGVPMTYWFESDNNKGNINGNLNYNNGNIRISIESKEKEIESLKEQLKLKDEIIELLKERK